MKKFSASCFSILFLLFFVFLAAGCGGGGGGVSAATGGNNAGKKGGAGGAGSAPTLRINPNDSPTLTGINWQTIDFTVKIGNRAPIKRTLNLGEIMDLNLSDADGLAVGETIDIEAKIVNAAGLEFEAFSGVKTITAGTNNVVMTVGRKVEIQLPANVTLEGGATYVVVTKNGATLPKATTTTNNCLRYWKRADNTIIYNGKLSPADFTTTTSLTPVFRTPLVGDIFCTDETIAVNVADLGGRTPFGIICATGIGGNDVVCVLSPDEYQCKLSDNYFAYSSPATYIGDTTLNYNVTCGLNVKEEMYDKFPNLDAVSPAYAYLKTLPNLPTGKQVNWYIPTVGEATSYFVTSRNAALTAIGSTPFSATDYMTCTMKTPTAGETYWSSAYYAKPDDNATTYRDDYATYSKRLRAIGYIRIH